MIGGRHVGIAHAEIDDVLAARAGLRLELVHLLEDVRRQPLDFMEVAVHDVSIPAEPLAAAPLPNGWAFEPQKRGPGQEAPEIAAPILVLRLSRLGEATVSPFASRLAFGLLGSACPRSRPALFRGHRIVIALRVVAKVGLGSAPDQRIRAASERHRRRGQRGSKQQSFRLGKRSIGESIFCLRSVQAIGIANPLAILHSTMSRRMSSYQDRMLRSTLASL